MDSSYTHCLLHVNFIISFEHGGFVSPFVLFIFVLIPVLLKYHTQLTHTGSPPVSLCPLSVSTKRSRKHFRQVVLSISGHIFNSIFSSPFASLPHHIQGSGTKATLMEELSSCQAALTLCWPNTARLLALCGFWTLIYRQNHVNIPAVVSDYVVKLFTCYWRVKCCVIESAFAMEK